jgi:ABC-type transport system substrate-binding protein
MASFRTRISDAVDAIAYEVGRLRGTDLVISCDGQRGKRGELLANQPDWIDQGVAVYFTVGATQRVIPCDRWNRIRDNLQAIAKTLEALRGVDRWGTKQIVDAAFEGFKALPAPPMIDPDPDWWEVLGVSPTAPLAVIRGAFKELAKERHPDRGGSDDGFRQLQRAYEAGLASGVTVVG